MKKLMRSKLKQLASWSSGYMSGGSDYWILYEFPQDKEKLLINSSGSNFGWEYDDWEYIDKPSPEILAKLLDEKLPEPEKCKLILAQKRTNIYHLNLEKPSD